MADDHAFLCEFCGYDLTGADPSGVCGECGKPVAESLPDTRRGTVWQNGGGPVCLIRTGVAVARSPRGVWSRVRIDGRSSAWLLVANAVLAGVLFGVGVDSLGWAPVFASIVLALSFVEYLGLRTFGRKNRWRVTNGVALTVVGHASFGWLVSAILSSAGWQFGRTLGGGLGLPQGLWSLAGATVVSWSVVLGIAGFLCGLAVFEVLVYLGVRRCRFANPPSARA
ncbi:MAG: hypothetical protein NXI14_11590 [bacterium]|nr:hypothetical protein [bacterium]